MQDELVNNPNMSEQKKWGIEDKITKLSADRDVLNWRRSRTTPPSVEDFEAKKGFIEQQKQFNQDAIVNGLGNGTLKVGSDEWYALQKKGDKLQEQIDAYNRGMMGVLDGEKAVTREEQAQNNPEHAYAIGTGGVKSTHDNFEDVTGNWIEGAADDASEWVGNAADNTGKWIEGAVTGAAKWVHDNKEPIRGIFEAAEAKKQKLLQAPIRNMNEDDFENYRDITLDNYSDELENRKPIKYAQELEAEKLGLIEEYNYISYENKLDWTELGVTNGEEYAQFIIENSNLSEEVLERVEIKQDSLYARKEEHLEQVYGLCQELNAREKEGKSFVVINKTGQELDQQTIDNAILAGLNNIGDEAGGMGEVLKRYYDDGNVLITITGCREQYYTQEEAQALYIEEQEEAKKLANLMFGMASADGIGSMLILLSDMLLNLNEDQKDNLEAVDTIFSTLSEEDISIEGLTLDKLESTVIDFIKEFTVNDITDMVSAIRWDIEDVNGGNY